jgi:hypothetical protein
MPKPSSPANFPYEIEYHGKTIRCRTVDDMQQALATLERSRVVREDMPWTGEEFTRFTGRIQLQQRRFLAALLQSGPAWMEAAELRGLLDIPDNKVLAGMLSGIAKVALIFAIEPRRVYTQDTRHRHGKPYRVYRINSEFQRTAATHSWPAKSDLKEPK